MVGHCSADHTPGQELAIQRDRHASTSLQCRAEISRTQPARSGEAACTFIIRCPETPCWEARCCLILFPSSVQHQLSPVVGLTSPLLHDHHRLFPTPTPLLIAAPPGCPCFFLLPTHTPPTLKSRSSSTFSMIFPDPCPGTSITLIFLITQSTKMY